MNEVKISDHLKSNYEDYYEDGDSEWRRLGAMGKVDNIVSLCSDLPQQQKFLLIMRRWFVKRMSVSTHALKYALRRKASPLT